MVIQAQSTGLVPASTHLRRPPPEVVGERRAKFLECFRQTGNILQSCMASGASRTGVKYAVENDPEFAELFRDAQEDATDLLEAAARERAVDGTTQERGVYFRGEKVDSYIIREYSDPMLTLLLKANRPAKFKERLEIESASIIKVYSGFDIDSV
jgi:hypothetical protein